MAVVGLVTRSDGVEKQGRPKSFQFGERVAVRVDESE